MQIDHLHETTCQRQGCRCTVPDGRPYCSEYCRATAKNAADQGEGHSTCTCGHPACRNGKAQRSRQSAVSGAREEEDAGPSMNVRLRAAFSHIFEVQQ